MAANASKDDVYSFNPLLEIRTRLLDDAIVRSRTFQSSSGDSGLLGRLFLSIFKFFFGCFVEWCIDFFVICRCVFHVLSATSFNYATIECVISTFGAGVCHYSARRFKNADIYIAYHCRKLAVSHDSSPNRLESGREPYFFITSFASLAT